MLSIILLLFFLIFECRKKQQISNCRNPLKSSTICLFNVYISCSNQPEFIISINLNVVHASVIFALYSFITRIIILALLNLINPIQFSSFSLNASLKFGFLHKIINVILFHIPTALHFQLIAMSASVCFVRVLAP